MSSPIITSTIQACVLNATSNTIAQFITAYRNNQHFTIDWKPIFQFVLFTALNTPPNLLWQYFIESSFPSHYTTPSPSAVTAASSGDEKELDREEKTHEITESHLSVRNTLIKVILDQTASASINTLLFSLAFAGFNGKGYSEAIAQAKEEFWPLITAGWKLWPLVSLLNFTLIQSVEMRNFMGGLAGLVWGVYLSMTRGEKG